MLNKLREKFWSVQSEVKTSVISALHLEEDRTRQEYLKGYSSEAGADLLNSYQDAWKELRLNAEMCGEARKTTSKDIAAIQGNMEKSAVSLNRFTLTLRDLSLLQEEVETVTDTIATLHTLCGTVESELVVLENMCEEEAMVKVKEKENVQLELYERDKSKKLEKTTSRLADNYARAQRSIDVRRREEKKEKQKVYQEKFDEDLDRYRAGLLTGVSKAPSSPGAGSDIPDLSTVELEPIHGSKELDAFFEEKPPSLQPVPKGGRLLSGLAAARRLSSSEEEMTSGELSPGGERHELEWDDNNLPSGQEDDCDNQQDIQQDVGDLQQDATDLQQDVGDVQQDSADLQPDSADLQRDAADFQRNTSNSHGNSADFQGESHGLQKDADGDFKNNTNDGVQTGDLHENITVLQKDSVHFPSGTTDEIGLMENKDLPGISITQENNLTDSLTDEPTIDPAGDHADNRPTVAVLDPKEHFSLPSNTLSTNCNEDGDAARGETETDYDKIEAEECSVDETNVVDSDGVATEDQSTEVSEEPTKAPESENSGEKSKKKKRKAKRKQQVN